MVDPTNSCRQTVGDTEYDTRPSNSPKSQPGSRPANSQNQPDRGLDARRTPNPKATASFEQITNPSTFQSRSYSSNLTRPYQIRRIQTIRFYDKTPLAIAHYFYFVVVYVGLKKSVCCLNDSYPLETSFTKHTPEIAATRQYG